MFRRILPGVSCSLYIRSDFFSAGRVHLRAGGGGVRVGALSGGVEEQTVHGNWMAFLRLKAIKDILIHSKTCLRGRDH